MLSSNCEAGADGAGFWDCGVLSRVPWLLVEVLRETLFALLFALLFGLGAEGGLVKRSATWFATTTAMPCVRASSRSSAPSCTSWVPRLAMEAAPLLGPLFSNSAR